MNMITQFLQEERKWHNAGRPYRTAERIKEIHDICTNCPLFEKGRGFVSGYDKCGECGCNLHPTRHALNKIAMATTECPKTDPEWTPDD